MNETVVRFYGGGPEDGNTRPVPDGILVVCFPRLLIERNKKGGLDLFEDAKFTHAYVRIDNSRFVYDGIVDIMKNAPWVVRLLQRTI